MRPWMEGKATLQELDQHWSIDDLADAHEAMDILIELETAQSAAAKTEAERKKGSKKK